MEFEETQFDDDEPVTKSKSQIKREAEALQDLGISISKLTPEQQASIPLDTSLRKAIEDAPKIKTNSAKRRHMQYIGKLMRSADIESISTAYDEIIESSHRATRQLHTIENWRDTLIANENAVERFFEKYPDTDRQHLRQTLRNAIKDKQKDKPDGARKLFRLIRDIIS